jgi:glycerol-3-phosphate acyltransferase PlsX
MSGDHGLRVNLPASLHALRTNTSLRLHLVGDSQAIQAEIGTGLPQRASIVHAPGILAMDASPTGVLRNTDQSSLRAALELLATGDVGGMISAGNTGALMALSRQRLSMIAGFRRPAFCSALPLPSGHSYLLDLGANVDCSPEQLHEFASMGSALAKALHGIHRPRIALLSNGREMAKGNSQIQRARDLLEGDESLEFVGFIEGDELLRHRAEVIVCDGMLGNVALKSMEGTAHALGDLLKASFQATPWRRFLSMLSRGALQEVLRGMDPGRHNGAFLLGVQGVVVKSHGAAREQGFTAAVQQAARCVENSMVALMTQRLDSKQ